MLDKIEHVRKTSDTVKGPSTLTHVIATSILFNRRVTFGAFLGIGRNPIGRFRVIFTLLLPQLYKSTNTRLMIRQTTTKAESMSTNTLYSRDYFSQLGWWYMAFDSIFTIWRWAPFQKVVVINVGPHQELAIASVHLWLDYHFDRLFIYY